MLLHDELLNHESYLLLKWNVNQICIYLIKYNFHLNVNYSLKFDGPDFKQ